METGSDLKAEMLEGSRGASPPRGEAVTISQCGARTS